MNFLADAFRRDYVRRRLSIEHSGWRSLPEIAKRLQIPLSRVYGDSRYGHTFGKPLEQLIKTSMVEFRIFPEQRGRGGRITKVRVNYENAGVKRVVDETGLDKSPRHSAQFSELGNVG